MNVQKNNSIQMAMQGAFILTVAGIITKILSAIYRVPYQNIVGDIGFYIYQQVYPLYGMSVILATSGFPVMVSKVMMEYGYGKSNQVRSKILTVSFFYIFISSFILSVILFFCADEIAMIMGDYQLTPLIQITSLAFIFTPFISTLRGYFQADQSMHPTAISQVIEQGIRVSVILISSYFLIRAGYNFYEAGFGALVGSIVGSIAAFCCLFYIWWKRGESKNIKWTFTRSPSISSKKIIISLLKYSWTICISSLLLILIQLIDSLNLYTLLVENGMDSNVAKETKGIYDRGQPLIQLGTVVATSLALSLVPLIATAKVRNDYKLIKEKLNLSIKLCVFIGAGAAAGLIAIIKPANVMLFTNYSGSSVLMILSSSILFTSLSLTLFAVLQGLGLVYMPALAVIIGVISKYYLNEFLITHYGINGAAVSSVLSYMIVTFITFLYLVKKGYLFQEYKEILKISLSCVLMVSVVTGVYYVFDLFLNLENRLQATYVTFILVFIGAIIYIATCLKIAVFTKEELRYIPIIKKFANMK
ncbi:putative polysaccharide biosynthesis protein [Metabacillus malikii]|uniref:PST family polysaccharide transporter n=1 Tax=Metabacillus malikii TaxID=1504265 RepID=A0ABT9ZNC0_9BACI|nr:polysaccharide biosynthesis protein [Metabacillus malikii]MDQ0233286.1 PST family polysaccharide transporter [Metabacillus malikii]